ncbi:MAG: hypothetical protein OXI96_07915 [Acidimicrobiaceae bacterium]|nr:hypothetical protein [Acidimicrobiaceae bacterium]
MSRSQLLLLRVLERCPSDSHKYAGLVLWQQILRFDFQPKPTLVSNLPPQLRISDSGYDSFLRQENDGEIQMNSLVQAWIDVAPVHLLEIACEHITRAFQQLASFHLNSTENLSDRMSFKRSAIERHSQDSIRTVADDVIDFARDSLIRLIVVDPQDARLWIDRALKSDVPLLRRIAVHGLEHDASRSADHRMQMIVELNLLDDIHLHHEVYHLMAELVPTISADALDRFVDHLLASWRQYDGENRDV